MTIQTHPNNFWKPHAGQQTRFLQSSAFEALFGGAASPGKTDCLLMESLRQIENPRYNGILFRRIFPSLEAADGLIARSLRWYPTYGGRYNSQKHYWIFPSGARVYFGHMQHEDDRLQYQGAQFGYIAFDELTEFTEKQYLYMFSRCRADANSGVRCYVRGATNPGNIGHHWVKRRFVVRDCVNRKRYFALVNDKDVEVDKTHPLAYSRAFYPATMQDNPSADPEYRKRIMLNPDPVERARLLEGDWDVEDTRERIYDNFSAGNISTDAARDPNRSYFIGVDDGYTLGQGPGTESYHPRVIVCCQRTSTGGINVFDEYVSTNELAEVSIKNVFDKYGTPEFAAVDSSAVDVKMRLIAQGVYAMGATHDVAEGIKNLRRLIRDGNGVHLVRVHPRCEHLIRELQSYRVDERTRAPGGDAKPLKLDDHGPDALRYAVWHMRTEG